MLFLRFECGLGSIIVAHIPTVTQAARLRNIHPYRQAACITV